MKPIALKGVNSAPLSVSFVCGYGRAIFSLSHSARQNSSLSDYHNSGIKPNMEYGGCTLSPEWTFYGLRSTTGIPHFTSGCDQNKREKTYRVFKWNLDTLQLYVLFLCCCVVLWRIMCVWHWVEKSVFISPRAAGSPFTSDSLCNRHGASQPISNSSASPLSLSSTLPLHIWVMT